MLMGFWVYLNAMHRLFMAASKAPWWLGEGLYLYHKNLEVIGLGKMKGGRGGVCVDDTVYHHFDNFVSVPY